MSENGILTKLT